MNLIRIVNLIEVLTKYKRLILISFLLISIITSVLIVLRPERYISTTTFIPVETQMSGHTRAVSLTWDFQIHFITQIPISNFTNNYIAYLKSGTLMHNIVKKLNLVKTYKVKTLGDAVEKLQKLTKIKISSGSIISVQVKDRSQQRAANIADEYVNQLRKVNKDIYDTTFTQQLDLVKQHLVESKQKIFNLVQSLQLFIENNRLSLPAKSIQNTISTAIEICAELSWLDIKYNNTTTHNNFSELEQKLIHLASTIRDNKHNFSSVKIETIIAKLIDDIRDEKIIYQQITIQIDELRNLSKETPLFFYVLDKAVPAEKPTRDIATILCLALLSGILVNVIIISTSEYIIYLRHQNPVEFEKIMNALTNKKC